MDLDEWEYLPDDAFLDFHEDSEEKRIFSSKRYSSDNSKSVFNMNYFIVPSPSSRSKVIHETTPRPPQPATPPPPASPVQIDSRLVPVPVQLELPPSFGKASSLSQEEQEEEKQVIIVSQVDQDAQLSAVYFKKIWENEFADMKILDSPKSPTCRSPKFMHQQTDKFQFDDNLGQEIPSPRMTVVDKNSLLESSEEINSSSSSNNNNNNNIWKLSFPGIGAICSFGFAAATICIIFFGAHQRNKQYQHNQNRFQIYTDDNKRIKQAVQDATKLNEAFSAVRVSLPNAHVTHGGGYYNGL